MNKHLMVATGVIVVISLFCNSCATIILGRSKEVGIASNPAGAKATVDGIQVITPANVTLKSNKDYTVKVEKEGYAPVSVTLNSRPSWWLLGVLPSDIIFGGFIGLVEAIGADTPHPIPHIIFGGLIVLGIDLAIGGGYTLSPDHIDVTLQPEPTPSPSQ